LFSCKPTLTKVSSDGRDFLSLGIGLLVVESPQLMQIN
jgi:hypothetical protein